MSAPSVVAVTGLRTFLGRSLAERLAGMSPGLSVVGIDIDRPYRLDARVRFRRVDLTEPTADVKVAEHLERERVDVVVHAAFRNGSSADHELDHELETIGSLHMLHACAAAKVRRLVVASSTMLYGPRPDNPNFLSEDHPLRGHESAHSVRNRVEVESLVADWRRAHPETEVTVLRACWIFGPTYASPITRYFSLPVVPVVMGFDPLLQFIHEEDCLAAFERATLESHPGVFNVVGKGVLPLSTLLRVAGRRRLALPPPLLRRFAYLPAVGRSGDSPDGFYDYLRYLWVADGSRGFAEFGDPYYTTREAWMAFVSSRRMRRYR